MRPNFTTGLALLAASLIVAFTQPIAVEGRIAGETAPTPTPGSTPPRALIDMGRFDPSGSFAPDSTGPTGWNLRLTPILPKFNIIDWRTVTPTPPGSKK